VVDKHQLRQFLLYIFALLIPCFALWTVASGPLAVPAVGAVNAVLTQWFPDAVNAVYVNGAKAVLMTEFGEQNGRLVSLAQAEFRLGFEVNTRILTYSLPFYTALHFATQKDSYLSSYLWGLLVLYPLIVFGLLCLCLRELMVRLGATFFGQTGVYVPSAEVIGILYQLNVLIIPTLAPAMVWAWQSRQSPLLRGAFSKQ
jgi:hypothetical protein